MRRAVCFNFAMHRQCFRLHVGVFWCTLKDIPLPHACQTFPCFRGLPDSISGNR